MGHGLMGVVTSRTRRAVEITPLGDSGMDGRLRSSEFAPNVGEFGRVDRAGPLSSLPHASPSVWRTVEGELHVFSVRKVAAVSPGVDGIACPASGLVGSGQVIITHKHQSLQA